MNDEVELRVALARAQDEATQARREVQILFRRIKRLEGLSGLNSDSLMTRALTVWGYYFLGSLVLSIPLAVVSWVVVTVLAAILAR